MWTTYVINDDGTLREVDRHTSEAYATADLHVWRVLNPSVEFIIKQEAAS